MDIPKTLSVKNRKVQNSINCPRPFKTFPGMGPRIRGGQIVQPRKFQVFSLLATKAVGESVHPLASIISSLVKSSSS